MSNYRLTAKNVKSSNWSTIPSNSSVFPNTIDKKIFGNLLVTINPINGMNKHETIRNDSGKK